MTTALQPLRWRRLLAFCAATVLAHYLAAGWVDGGGAPLPPVRNRPPAPVVAELRAAAPSAEAAKPAAVPAPRRPEASAAVPARQVQSANTGAATGHLKARPPPPAELRFDLVRAGAGGEAVTGEAVLDWNLAGAAYRLRHTAALTHPQAGALAELASEGRVGEAGLVPRTMTEQRRSRARTATHFDERGNITFSATERAVPMQPGAQDKATWPMQLSAIARAGAAKLAGGVAVQVGEDKDASVYRFVVLGQEQIETGIGALATWRLARLAAPGTYNARLDIWLAPGHEWYPVQLRSTEANGTVTTQTIRRIVVKEAGN